MTAGNFDDTLKIDSAGRLAPRGPLKRAAGETDTELYIWVVQANSDGSGAFVLCEGVPSADGTVWTMEAGSEEQKGRFVPGPAIGSGMQTGKVAGKTIVAPWSESLELTET